MQSIPALFGCPLQNPIFLPILQNPNFPSSHKTLAALHPSPSHISPSPPQSAQKPSIISRPSARSAAVAELQQTVELGSALSRYGGTLQVQDLNVILRHFGNLKRWKDVSQLFDWMQNHRKVNVVSYSSFIKFMGTSHNPVKALQVYTTIQDKSTRINSSICNSVLGCLVRNGKFDASMKLFNQMKSGGLMPNVVTYSTLLAGCIKVKDGYSKALKLVQDLENRGLHMDSVIYGTLLAICASNNLCKEAETFFQRMKNEGHSPNLFHYSSLLNAYSVNGNHVKADMLLKDIESAGLVPNKVMLTTLLKVYVRGGLFEKSRELLVKLEALGFAQEEMPYCIIMDGLVKAGHIHEAKVVFEEMRNKNVKSDGYSHSIMISAFCRNGLLEDAKQLARDFEATYEKYDLVLLNNLLRAYCKAGDMKSVMQMLKKMDELAISPDRKTFHILANYYCKEKLYQLAYRMVEDMHSKGHLLDEILCSSLILQLGQAGASSEAYSVYNMLRYSKRAVSKALHEKILNILVAGGLLKEAYVVMKDNAKFVSRLSQKRFAVSFMKSGNINVINDVIKALHSSGHKIDQVVFDKAIARYIAQPEKKELLLHLLQWMIGQGYAVDSTTRNLLLKNSQLFGRQLIAEILSKQQAMSKKVKTKDE
ncbi:hypothetical protein MRB53_006807 [Persea americana]|uniref:Uncharacterized protein n=1 Tax=Persea americana TaxID=3435 RepID=A0ACC2MI99_PERAE|nr:hypothetical protein MRB53_006807 [Persea americana]|eukprot:TRINITY_DN2316_c0_g1_i1.p1 TRINITY_DN2316_c0_g1~~TRINITY_DN2316_c0_g1_i1.p1  ORF type:complete len:650 (-),score=116.15 TRINITY_DN2316_c0_g1_i1:560-2509(-)